MDDLTDWIGTVIAIGGFAFGLWQYWRNSKEARARARREKAVVAANEMETFGQDPAVKSALLMMDWNSPFIQLTTVEGALQSVRVDSELFASALRHHRPHPKLGWSWLPEEKRELLIALAQKPGVFVREETEIRAIFDRFLDRLERIDNLISRDVISAEDFRDYFSYWLDLLGETPPPGTTASHFSPIKRAALWSYVDGYQFKGVRRLFARFGRADVPSR